MPLPQHLHYGVGGSISIELDHRPANAYVDIVDGNGTAKCSGAVATVSTASTVINTAVSRGDREISVTSNAGIAAGDVLKITDDPEQILVRKVDGCNVYLRRPAICDHVNGATVEGLKVSLAVNSQIANTMWFDGHAVWNINSGAAFFYTGVECTKYPTRMLCGTQILFDLEPKAYQLLDDEADAERLKDMAAEYVLGRLAAASSDLRARLMPGDTAFQYAVGLAAWMIYYRRQRGDDAAELYERFRDALTAELDRMCQVTPRDADQDGAVEEDERISIRSVRIIRG